MKLIYPHPTTGGGDELSDEAGSRRAAAPAPEDAPGDASGAAQGNRPQPGLPVAASEHNMGVAQPPSEGVQVLSRLPLGQAAKGVPGQGTGQSSGQPGPSAGGAPAASGPPVGQAAGVLMRTDKEHPEGQPGPAAGSNLTAEREGEGAGGGWKKKKSHTPAADLPGRGAYSDSLAGTCMSCGRSCNSGHNKKACAHDVCSDDCMCHFQLSKGLQLRLWLQKPQDFAS